MDRPPERYIDMLSDARPWLAGLAILAVQFSLCANILRLTTLLKPFENGPATSPMTALCVSIISVALISLSHKGPHWLSTSLLLFAMLVASISALPARWTTCQSNLICRGKWTLTPLLSSRFGAVP